MNDRQPTSEQKSSLPPGMGIALGVSIGVAIGVAMDKLALGIAIGVGVGAALDAGLRVQGQVGQGKTDSTEDDDGTPG